MDLTDLTVIHESYDGGEVDMLTFMLDRARAQFAWKCGGLDEAGLRATRPPSTLTLGGLLKHCAGCEERMISTHLTGEPPPPPWDTVPPDTDWEFRTAAEDSPKELYDLWCGAVEHSKAAWASALAGGGLDRPSRWTSPDGITPTLRRIYVDLNEHYLRHTGHADLLRESVDGQTGEDPPQP